MATTRQLRQALGKINNRITPRSTVYNEQVLRTDITRGVLRWRRTVGAVVVDLRTEGTSGWRWSSKEKANSGTVEVKGYLTSADGTLLEPPVDTRTVEGVVVKGRVVQGVNEKVRDGRVVRRHIPGAEELTRRAEVQAQTAVENRLRGRER